MQCSIAYVICNVHCSTSPSIRPFQDTIYYWSSIICVLGTSQNTASSMPPPHRASFTVKCCLSLGNTGAKNLLSSLVCDGPAPQVGELDLALHQHTPAEGLVPRFTDRIAQLFGYFSTLLAAPICFSLCFSSKQCLLF